jgi:hypothetical protein
VGRVLLVAVTDPVDARRIWMAPGGGRDETVRVTWIVRGVNCGRRRASASRSYGGRCSSASTCSAGPGACTGNESASMPPTWREHAGGSISWTRSGCYEGADSPERGRRWLS